MVSFPPLLKVLSYFSRYSYPLTAEEIWFWQENTSYSLPQIQNLLVSQKYYYLPGHKSDIKLRLLRQKISARKFKIASEIINHLSRMPFISAIYITGALSMSNSPPNDDIDLLFITQPYTLWISRFLVVMYLKYHGWRRPTDKPEHSSPQVSNTICDNLWLSAENLEITEHNLYTAHELLQAKCVFDRGGVHRKFLLKNSWAGDFLPVAYRESLKKLDIRNLKLEIINYFIILWPINVLFFIIQYLYMLPRKTSEKVSLGHAYFHPRSPKIGNL